MSGTSTTSSNEPRTLTKGESYIWCAFACFILGIIVFIALNFCAKITLNSETFRGPIFHTLLLLISSVISIAIMFAAWSNSKLPQIPIGWKGVPTFLDGRVNWFQYPEGDNMGFIGLIKMQADDVRMQLLVSADGHQSIHIKALAKSTPQDLKQNGGTTLTARSYFVPVTFIASVPYHPVDLYKWFGYSDPRTTLMNKIIAAIRFWAKDQEVLDLPNQKDVATDILKSVAASFAEIGAEPGPDVQMMDIEIPDEITKASIQISIEEIQYATESRQANTLAAAVELLRGRLPGLSDQELSNMVMGAAGLAKMNINVVNNQGTGRPTTNVNVLGQHENH